MARALEDEPPIPFRIPPGIRLVRVNAATGKPAKPWDKTVILEAFKPGTEPGENPILIDGSDIAAGTEEPGTAVPPVASPVPSSTRGPSLERPRLLRSGPCFS